MVFPWEQAIVAVIIGRTMDPVEAQQLEFPKSCSSKNSAASTRPGTWDKPTLNIAHVNNAGRVTSHPAQCHAAGEVDLLLNF